MAMALLLAAVLLASFATNIGLTYRSLRQQHRVDELTGQLWLRDEKALSTHKDITSDIVLVQEYGDTPVGNSDVLQAWLLQPQRMMLKASHDDVWVTVKRDKSEIVICGQIYHHRITAWGPTYNRASATFLKVAYPEFPEDEKLPC